MNEPRPYHAERDWQAMLNLLSEGRRANTGAYYVHPGDVSWWLHYPDQRAQFPQRIFLWEEFGRCLGWCLLTPAENYFDLFVHPTLDDAHQIEIMLDWVIARLPGPESKMTWIAESDSARIESLLKRGFSRRPDALIYHTRSLADPIPAPNLPAGFTIRATAGEAEAEERARASHAAFRSKWEWSQYLDRRLSFMRSPIYNVDRDRVAVAPNGRIASFCIYWLDPVNKVGLFEPVGTHPDFQGRGLGKALLFEALARMKAEGMETAIVCADVNNPAAQRLYESVGFRRDNLFLTFGKYL